ncbi:hypothetical protein RFI_21171 [Reticulomyxa filosa]|uniref:Uncharacterized protein n=1 Tax=Reticulomyxa filosa TaxID=46433 RepID=X6MSV0_RETFI|nr:hypothetical protein RFI_21171 [Reticulomyxa filosa]|eukprot:ETO16190.1 hypothetical protein RFI_21171 [Reticulomyxa filosa]
MTEIIDLFLQQKASNEHTAEPLTDKIWEKVQKDHNFEQSEKYFVLQEVQTELDEILLLKKELDSLKIIIEEETRLGQLTKKNDSSINNERKFLERHVKIQYDELFEELSLKKQIPMEMILPLTRRQQQILDKILSSFKSNQAQQISQTTPQTTRSLSTGSLHTKEFAECIRLKDTKACFYEKNCAVLIEEKRLLLEQISKCNSELEGMKKTFRKSRIQQYFYIK